MLGDVAVGGVAVSGVAVGKVESLELLLVFGSRRTGSLRRSGSRR